MNRKRFASLIMAFMIFAVSMFAINVDVKVAGNPWDPWSAVYNMGDYINYNPEVSQYFTAQYKSTGKSWDANDVWNHFLNIGMKKGLRASQEFDVKVYMQKYPDLVAVYGNDLPKYYQHYALVGKAEGRNCLAEAAGNTNWGAARNAAVKAKCDSYRATNGGMDCDIYGDVPHLICHTELNDGANYDHIIATQGGYYDVELAEATYKYMAEKYNWPTKDCQWVSQEDWNKDPGAYHGNYIVVPTGYSAPAFGEMLPWDEWYKARSKELCFNGFHHGSWMKGNSTEICLKNSVSHASPEAIEQQFAASPMHLWIMEQGLNYCTIYIYNGTMYVALK